MTSDIRNKIIKILNEFDHYLTIKKPRGEEYQQTRDVSVLELVDLFESELAQTVKENNRLESIRLLKSLIEMDDYRDPVFMYLQKGKSYECKIQKLLTVLAQSEEENK